MRSENFVMGMIINVNMYGNKQNMMVMRKIGKTDSHTDDTYWVVIRELDRVENEFKYNEMYQEGQYAEFSI
jgi:hypothetical protein